MLINEFICSHEECLELIRQGINRYSSEELQNLINNQGIYNGIGIQVHNLIGRANYDDYGNVYLYDELDPYKIAVFIRSNPKYQIEEELVYCRVCYVLQKLINAFYKELSQYEKDCTIDLKFNKHKCSLEQKEYWNRYTKAMDARIRSGYKRIRRNC